MSSKDYLDSLLIKCNEKLFKEDGFLDSSEESKVKELIKTLNEEKDYRDNILFELEKIQMYNFDKKSLLEKYPPDIAKAIINKRRIENDELLVEAKTLVEENETNRDYMFGYPANLFPPDPIERKLREEEAKLPYMNNCGDSSPKNRGNYVMDTKNIEQNILDEMYINLGIDKKDYWGYITSGGTEGNYWGIRTGFELYPNGKLYFSASTHYSVPKYARLIDNKEHPELNINIFDNQEIDSTPDGKIDTYELLSAIVKNYKDNKTPAILLLNWGTTVTGAIDDVKYINTKLENLGIPHYTHLDAALFGGIPKNQISAPAIRDLNSLKVNSVSISLHKYIGSNMTNGVLICKRDTLNKKNNLQIDYIGQKDPTYLGSRSFLPFTTQYKVLKAYNRTEPYEFNENIEFFKKLADEKGLKYEATDNSNIMIVTINNSDIQHKYQLASFGKNSEKAHIILFPYHKKEIISELIDDLMKIQNMSKDPVLILK